MRGPRVKFAGIVVAIIGFLILAALGAAYAWGELARDFIGVDWTDYTVHAVIGGILLVVGILIYIFIEE